MEKAYLTEVNEYLDKIGYKHSDIGVNKMVSLNLESKSLLRNLLKGDDIIIGKTITHIEWSYEDCKNMANIMDDKSLTAYFLNIRNISSGSPFITVLEKGTKAEILSQVPVKNRKRVSRVLKVGTKISRLLSASFGNYDLNLEYSKMMQRSLGMKVHLSVKPIDFLSMSDGKSWSSCHSMRSSGDYSSAGMALASDKYALIAWAGINKYAKIWRQIWFVDTRGAIISSLPYPNANKIASKTVENFLRKELSEKLDLKIVKQKGNFITKTFKKKSKGFFSDVTVYCKTRDFSDKQLEHVGITAFATPKYKWNIDAGGKYYDLVDGTELKETIPYRPENYNLYYNEKCDKCGKWVHSEDVVYINNEAYCEDCQEELVVCDSCEDYFEEDDGVYVHIDGAEAFVCPECAKKYNW